MTIRLILFLSIFIGGYPAKGEESITILFENSYPNFYLYKNKITGNEYSAIFKAFEKAKITQKWIPSSYKRILISLKDPKAAVCAAAYSKNKERLKIFNFSKPMFKIGKSVLLTRKTNIKKLKEFKGIENIILNTELQGGFQNLPGGWLTLIDKNRKTKVQHIVYSVGGHVAIKLLERERVDFIIIEEFAADHFIASKPKGAYAKLSFENQGTIRELHLMCSKNVHTNLIEAFNNSYDYVPNSK